MLHGDSAAINGEAIKEFDYVRHLDQESGEEYFTGTEPDEEDIYIAHDVIYYPELPEESFVLENYDGETEWVSRYKNEEMEEYIFATLPNLGNDLPTEMMHSEEETYDNPVLDINKAEKYILKGTFNGQIAIDLGDEAFTNKNEK